MFTMTNEKAYRYKITLREDAKLPDQRNGAGHVHSVDREEKSFISSIKVG